jgi:cytochrome c-type biogenesis protein CcmH
MIGFVAVGIVLTLAAVAVVVVPLFRDPAARAPVAGLVVALAIPAATALLYAMVSTYPWPGRAAAPESPAMADASIGALQRRVSEQPDDAPGWLRLGQAYLAAERFTEARNAYQRAMALAPGDPDARLGWAEAAILADRTALAGDAGKIVEEVVAQDPANPRALWYGGMIALERGATDVARDRWQRLLALSPPEQVRQIIEVRLAELAGSAGTTAAAPADGGSPGLRLAVRISIAPGLASRIRPSAPLFLIARHPDRPGPPLAVVRRESQSLPATVEITDADVMVPGQTLGDVVQMKLTARVSNGGDATATSGDVFGEIVWSRGHPGPLEITMDRVVP